MLTPPKRKKKILPDLFEPNLDVLEVKIRENGIITDHCKHIRVSWVVRLLKQLMK